MAVNTAVPQSQSDILEEVKKIIFLKGSPVPEEFQTKVEGYRFPKLDKSGRSKIDYHALLQSYRTSGFQATNFGLAVDQINQMVSDYNAEDANTLPVGLVSPSDPSLTQSKERICCFKSVWQSSSSVSSSSV